MSKYSDNPKDEATPAKSSLSLTDKIWIGVVVAIFVVAFAVILIYGVF